LHYIPRNRIASNSQLSLFQSDNNKSDNNNYNFFDSLKNALGGQSNPYTTIFSIPTRTVKIGALRFFLQIYLVGEQNKPSPKAWSIQQEEDNLQVYYSDGTGMIEIRLSEYSIEARRHGNRPSLAFRLQESVLLHGLLDEIQNLALDVDDIAVEKRLVQLADDGAIDKARSELPARPVAG
jgi:hypothetical protein